MALSKTLAQNPKAAAREVDRLRDKGWTYPHIRDYFIRKEIVGGAAEFETLMLESGEADAD